MIFLDGDKTYLLDFHPFLDEKRKKNDGMAFHFHYS